MGCARHQILWPELKSARVCIFLTWIGMSWCVVFRSGARPKHSIFLRVRIRRGQPNTKSMWPLEPFFALNPVVLLGSLNSFLMTNFVQVWIFFQFLCSKLCEIYSIFDSISWSHIFGFPLKVGAISCILACSGPRFIASLPQKPRVRDTPSIWVKSILFRGLSNLISSPCRFANRRVWLRKWIFSRFSIFEKCHQGNGPWYPS